MGKGYHFAEKLALSPNLKHGMRGCCETPGRAETDWRDGGKVLPRRNLRRATGASTSFP